MKKILSLLFFCLSIGALKVSAQVSLSDQPKLGLKDPWAANELIEPAQLAASIKLANGKTPIILNIGAVEDIKGAKHIGPAEHAENLEKLKETVAKLPKNTVLVIYCGCCPFYKCPNIRPAFNELKKLGFTKIRLLNLPTNLKTNWIAYGYPLAAE